MARKPSFIVLGGGGFIGTNLCRRLVSSGCRVRAFGRRCAFPDELEGVEWYRGDFSDVATLASAIEGYDIVFHLVHSSAPYSANLNMAADLRQNVMPTIALLDISRNLGVKRIVFVSSGGVVYGPAKQSPTPETAPTEPITAHGISKLAIEKYLALYEHLHGLDFRVLRVSNAFGPFQVAAKHQGIVAALIGSALGKVSVDLWGDGSVVRDYIFVTDVIDAMEAAAADLSDERVFNIGTGHGRSIRAVISAIEKLMGQRLDIAWKPSRPIDVPSSVLSVERAKAVLGWTPKTPFGEGLEQTIAWWRKETKLSNIAGTRRTSNG